MRLEHVKPCKQRARVARAAEERKSSSEHGAEQHRKTNASIRNNELARPGDRAWALARALRARARPFRGRSVVQSFRDFPRAPHAFQGASESIQEASESLRTPPRVLQEPQTFILQNVEHPFIFTLLLRITATAASTATTTTTATTATTAVTATTTTTARRE